MNFRPRATQLFARFFFIFALSSMATPRVFAQIAPSSPPTNPPMWASDPTVTGTDDWDQWKKNCHDMTTQFGKDSFLSCATSAFRSRPFHFVAQSIVPGSGVGGGGYYGRDLNESDGSQDTLQATSLITIRKFWYAELKFTTIRAITADWNKSGESLALTAYARNRSLPVMTFYGLGPTTNVNKSVKFSQRDTSAGVELTKIGR